MNFLAVEPAPGFVQRPARGVFRTDGYFEAQAFNDKAGLVPGRYKVRIECLKHAPVPGPIMRDSAWRAAEVTTTLTGTYEERPKLAA